MAILSIPLSILLAFIVMRLQGLGANIMSLGGIAISIGVLVDAAIIMVENAHKHYEEWQGKRSHFEIILRSAQEVGPTLFFTLLVITVSFMPVFTLQAQEGRLFRPLAFTKTYAMAMSSLLAVTVIPVLMYWFVRGKIHSERAHPVSRLLRWLYTPVLNLRSALAVAGSSRARSCSPRRSGSRSSDIGSEFMPPLWEGDLLYMPTTFPGLSITKAKEILQQTDKILRTFPEVESVFGKIGRAETATDPAPLSMIETTIVLKDPSRVAARDDEGQAHRGDGPGDPVPGRDQRLDHAHQDPHRHALDRHQDAGGHQDRGARPARCWRTSARRSRRSSRRCPARSPPTPSG